MDENYKGDVEPKEAFEPKEYTYSDLLDLDDHVAVVRDILIGMITVEGTTDPIVTATNFIEDLEANWSGDTSRLWDMVKFEIEIANLTFQKVW